ncbi:hypothetical protein AVEN_187670-1 [Araneus ventricosus]|uniref:Thyroglobulin type-1 domain-containing protein n=1 Tax=Araneus ventricosus TaxID=182803 RepID=A0A4Y2M6K3_ARAVE|nr:hypothetical protein AVEN_187670-1 [Araneus ventricosus]
MGARWYVITLSEGSSHVLLIMRAIMYWTQRSNLPFAAAESFSCSPWMPRQDGVPVQLITMKTFAVIVLSCLLAAVSCWEFPGYPGVDCPTARQKMALDPDNRWMMPRCNGDGTFQDLQCYDQYPDVPDTCMCVALDGTPLTLAGFGLDVKTCDCLLAQYRIFENGKSVFISLVGFSNSK